MPLLYHVDDLTEVLYNPEESLASGYVYSPLKFLKHHSVMAVFALDLASLNAFTHDVWFETNLPVNEWFKHLTMRSKDQRCSMSASQSVLKLISCKNNLLFVVKSVVHVYAFINVCICYCFRFLPILSLN